MPVSGRTEHTLGDDAGELVSIEVPLVIRTETGAGRGLERLLDRLGGREKVAEQLRRRDPNRPVELCLSGTANYVDLVAGEWVPTTQILVRIVKRTQRRRAGATRKRFTLHPVGVVGDTVRFRALGDFHFSPQVDHPIQRLAADMAQLNAHGILHFAFRSDVPEHGASIDFFPPPIFSRYLVPRAYEFKANPASVAAQTPGGAQRFVNRSRYSCSQPQAIPFEQPTVPQGPLAEHVELRGKSHEALYEKVISLFEKRPVWSRLAFQNQLSLSELRALRHNKHFLASTCYTFVDGVFKDLLVKFGYDPRLISEARFYQRVSLRNLDKREGAEKFTFKLMKRPAVASAIETPRDHIFDGQELHQSIGTFQLCDITDSLLVMLIQSSKGVLPHCRLRDGWYTSNAIEQIRSILRRKFRGLLDQKRVVRDTECVDLLEIDVRPGAQDLIKKVSNAEKKWGGKNVTFKAHLQGVVISDGEPDQERALLSQPAPSKPLFPNPLLRSRKNRRYQRLRPKQTGDSLNDELRREIQGRKSSLVHKLRSATFADSRSTAPGSSELSSLPSDSSSLSNEDEEWKDEHDDGDEDGDEDEDEEEEEEEKWNQGDEEEEQVQSYVQEAVGRRSKGLQKGGMEEDVDVEMKGGWKSSSESSELTELSSLSRF